MCLEGPVERLVAKWTKIKSTPAALAGDDIDGLKTMSHDDLALLAFEALGTLERLEGYEYLRGCLEDHLEGPGDFQCGWVIAQADGGTNAGGFNKWSKAVGGFVFNQPRYEHGALAGDALVHFSWTDAKAAFDKMYKDDSAVAACMKIYPVVISAGNEPRITCPPEETKRAQSH